MAPVGQALSAPVLSGFRRSARYRLLSCASQNTTWNVFVSRGTGAQSSESGEGKTEATKAGSRGQASLMSVADSMQPLPELVGEILFSLRIRAIFVQETSSAENQASTTARHALVSRTVRKTDRTDPRYSGIYDGTLL